MSSTKTIGVTNNANELFTRDIAEKIAARDKLFRKFLKCKFLNKILYKKARNTVQALIKDKKRKLLQEKLSENIEKPKELWKIIKIGFTRQKSSHNKHMPQYEK